jgi:catechol O-methyltransferase
MRPRLTAALTAGLVALAAALAASPDARRVCYLAAALAGRKLPPALRTALPFLPALAGDGREEAAAAFVLSHAPPGNLSAAIAAFEAFASSQAWMMAVGPVKGKIVTDALAASGAGGGGEGGPDGAGAGAARGRPHKTSEEGGPIKILELGTYCGFGSLLLAAAAPTAARIYTVEVEPRFAAIARSILAHAGVGPPRVSVLEGPLSSHLLAALAAADPPGAPLDFVFVDHDKEAYLPDVRALLAHPAPLVRSEGGVKRGEHGGGTGTAIVADNLRVPGAPAYVAWLRSRPPSALRTAWHDTELEWTNGLVRDVVAASVVVDAAAALEG